jgi:zinc D-Ala-D-Ala dipeptidase
MIRTAIIAAVMLSISAPAEAQPKDPPRPADFVDVKSVAPAIVVDARYATAQNFVGARIDGYEKPLCYLTRPAAAALAQVVADLEPRGLTIKVFDRGLTIKVFDCYRPERAVAHFVRWARNLNDTRTKAEFYPEVEKRDLFNEGYIAARSGHSRGSTADLTLARRSDGQELDMGTPFDFFSPLSWPSNRSVSKDAQANRALLAQAMRKRGFMAYDKEWWHFTLRNEPYPQTYFNFVVR